MLSVENFEKAVEKSFDTLYLLQRICDMGNLPHSKQVIEQCRAGKSWRMKDFTEQKYEFLDEMLGDFTTRFQTSNSSTHREQRSLLDQDDVVAILSRHPEEKIRECLQASQLHHFGKKLIKKCLHVLMVIH